VAAAPPPLTRVRWTATCRLVPSRYPSVGLFDDIASPEDLDAILELEAWTNDRLSTELGMLHRIGRDEWVTAEPMASVIMAAFCHPKPGGGRFSTEDRGAWYAARHVDTALAESVYHRTRELVEVGHFETRVQMRLYHADFSSTFHDVRGRRADDPLYDPDSYTVSQPFARELFEHGSNGIVYNSVRHPGGQCLGCFRPKLVTHVRVAAHYEYVWEGRPDPRIRRLTRE
jgi:RES domain-containing protein